jgi:hypothetical protein
VTRFAHLENDVPAKLGAGASRPWPVAFFLSPSATDTTFAYDDTTRVHRAHGRPVLSVTQVLHRAAELGMMEPRRSARFLNLLAVPESRLKVIQAKGALGTRVHAAAHYADEGDLLRTSVWSEALPYLVAWESFRDTRGFSAELLETVVASPTHHYIGRFDRLGRVRDNRRLVLVDLKTGDPENASADLQLAGYLHALLEQHPRLAHAVIADTYPDWPIPAGDPSLPAVAFGLIDRWAVQLTPTATSPIKVHVYPTAGRTADTDRREFLALVHEVNAHDGLLQEAV